MDGEPCRSRGSTADDSSPPEDQGISSRHTGQRGCDGLMETAHPPERHLLMASVNRTIRALIESCPCGYDNRTEALHQILVVLGAGYEWRDGQVVSRDPDTDTCVSMHQWFTEQCPAEDLRDRAAELALTPGPLRNGAYPPCEFTLLLNVPADVEPDWAEAAAEIAAVVGPLWITGADLLPHERNLDSPHRKEALRRLEAAYGAAVFGSGS